MDPLACYRDLLAALNAQDLTDALELAENLQAWLARGGFYPEGALPADVDRTIALVLQ